MVVKVLCIFANKFTLFGEKLAKTTNAKVQPKQYALFEWKFAFLPFYNVFRCLLAGYLQFHPHQYINIADFVKWRFCDLTEKAGLLFKSQILHPKS